MQANCVELAEFSRCQISPKCHFSFKKEKGSVLVLHVCVHVHVHLRGVYVNKMHLGT